MNPYYSIILEQTGLNAFKELISKWHTLADTLTEKTSNLPILLPDIFLVSQSGSGRTLLVKLLAEYLSYDEKLMDFYGDVKYFEFLLNYCSPREHFTEIERLMTEVSDAAGFRNEFKGIIFIDINEWVGHCEEKHFLDFLEYLADNSDNWLVVLSVNEAASERIAPLRSLISAFLRIESVTIEAPTVDELSNYLFDMIMAYHFTLDDRAQDLLKQTVATFCADAHFDGYKTIKRLAQDIVYSLYCQKVCPNTRLYANDVEAFSSDSLYVKRTLTKIKTTKKIGF